MKRAKSKKKKKKKMLYFLVSSLFFAFILAIIKHIFVEQPMFCCHKYLKKLSLKILNDIIDMT